MTVSFSETDLVAVCADEYDLAVDVTGPTGFTSAPVTVASVVQHFFCIRTRSGRDIATAATTIDAKVLNAGSDVNDLQLVSSTVGCTNGPTTPNNGSFFGVNDAATALVSAGSNGAPAGNYSVRIISAKGRIAAR